MDKEYFVFRTDGDGKQYLIPEKDADLFKALLEEAFDTNDYRIFSERFNNFKIGYLYHYKFQNPTIRQKIESSLKVNEQTFNEVKEIILDVILCDEDTITPEALFIDDLGADSLDMYEMMMNFEYKYNIYIEMTDEELEKIKTVGDAVKLVDLMTKNKGK